MEPLWILRFFILWPFFITLWGFSKQQLSSASLLSEVFTQSQMKPTVKDNYNCSAGQNMQFHCRPVLNIFQVRFISAKGNYGDAAVLQNHKIYNWIDVNGKMPVNSPFQSHSLAYTDSTGYSPVRGRERWRCEDINTITNMDTFII